MKYPTKEDREARALELETQVMAERERPNADDGLRQQPNSLIAEKAVLGCCLLDNPCFLVARGLLEAQDFYDAGHRAIWEAMIDLEQEGKNIAADTVAIQTELNGTLELAGGPTYISVLESSVLSTKLIGDHADVVKDTAKTRQLIHMADSMSNAAFIQEGTAADLTGRAIADLLNLQQDVGKGKGYHVSNYVSEALEWIEDVRAAGDEHTGIVTDFPRLDEATGGWQPSDLVIIAARPSVGKTAFAMQLAFRASIRHKIPVLVFSLEQPGRQLIQRAWSMVSGIALNKIRSPNSLTTAEMDSLAEHSRVVVTAPLKIVDTPALDIRKLRAMAQEWATRNAGKGLIVVDYLSLVGNEEGAKAYRNKVQEVGQVSQTLKQIARETDKPVICLSQLSRKVEQRGKNAVPVLSDLRETGQIEQDADVVAFLHRMPEGTGSKYSTDERIDLLIEKHRNGPLARIGYLFDGPVMTFDECSYTQEESEAGQ